jgi:hypothetical protein
MDQALIINPAKDVVDLTERGAIVLANLHILANKLDWSLRCERCGQPVQGRNNTSEAKFLSVQCGCREYRAEISTRNRGRI